MKFLALTAALLPAALANVATRTTPDIAALSDAIAKAVPSMYYCQLSAKVYKHPELGGSNGLSSWESGCAYFESLHVPPIQKALEPIVSAPLASLSGISSIESNLTKLLGHFDDFATNAKGRDEDLRFVACQFITGATQPNGEKVGAKPNLGEPTSLMLKTLAKELTRAGQLPELAKKAADYAAKIELAMKFIRPTCGQGGVSSSTLSTATTISTPYPTNIGVPTGVPSVPSGVPAPGVNGTQPGQPGQPGSGNGGAAPPAPTPGAGGVIAGAGYVAPSMMMMGAIALGSLLVL